MTDGGIDQNEIQVTGDSAAPVARTRRRVVVVVAGVVGAIAIYLALTFTMPTVVPRLNQLPKPAESWEPAGDGCNTTHVDWEKDTFVWQQTRFSTMAGCITGG